MCKMNLAIVVWATFTSSGRLVELENSRDTWALVANVAFYQHQILALLG